jgi:hypothetical protein
MIAPKYFENEPKRQREFLIDALFPFWTSWKTDPVAY